jgi:hypothetical protein
VDPQNQQLQNTITPEQPQPASPIEPIAAKSRLSLVGVILAVVCPPLGLTISIIALAEIEKNHLRGRAWAIFGVIWGIIFTVPLAFILFLVIAGGGLRRNDAEKYVQPFITQIQEAGGRKLCENGDTGFGPDNTQPWYEAYYEIPNSAHLTYTVTTDAAQAGYPLHANTRLANQLKGVPDKNGSLSQPYSGATFNPKADYLIGGRNGRSLTITINRDASVPLYCNSGSYGKKQPTGGSNAILDIFFELPDRNT